MLQIKSTGEFSAIGAKNEYLLEGQVHFAAFAEQDTQHLFRPPGKLSFHRAGLLAGARSGTHLNQEKMLPGRDLHGVEFMPLNVVENY